MSSPDSASLHGLSQIAGAPGLAGGRLFQAVDPTTGERLPPDFHEASAAEVDCAMLAGTAAFEALRVVAPENRARLLDTIAFEIEALGEPLLQRAQAETGLPAPRLQGERARTCNQLRLFAQTVREGSWVDARIDPALPTRQPLPRADLRRMLRPLGPVVVFGSSNFPLAFSVAGGDTASALAAGCPVVVKAHRAHPGTSELVGHAIARAVAGCGLPAGVFSLIHGGGASIGVELVRHPATAAVGFTGSRAAGRALFEAAASRPHPIPVFAEMSSLNPVFLLPGALQARGAALAQALFGSFTLGVGQFCTKPGLVFLPNGKEAEAFLQVFTELVRGASGGTMLTPGIRDSFEQNRDAIIALPEVRILASSATVADPAKTQGRPSAAVTTAQNFLRTPALATEAFGPFTLVVVAETPGEFVDCAEALEGQLTATVHGTAAELAGARPLLAALEKIAGRLLLNGFPTGVEVCPAMNHGGPYPATTDTRFTSVGTAAMLRFARPVCYQDFADELLPAELQNANPRGIMRLVDGRLTREPVASRP